MTDETFDQLYGNKGIDTDYERDTITYRPNLKYTKESIQTLLFPDIQQSIERARTFTISQNLSEYDELIAEVNQMLTDIEARNDVKQMTLLKSYIAQKQFSDLFAFEKEQSGYQQTGDYELYSSLSFMRDSMQTRRDFLDTRFRTQFTDETDLEKITEAESNSIDEWEQLEAKVAESYQGIVNQEEDPNHIHPLDDDSLTTNQEHLNLETLDALEKQKRNKELFHTSLADTSYIHRNRYFLFLETIEKAKVLVYSANSLIEDGLKEFMMSLNNLSDVSVLKSHLILQFKKIKEKHESLKGRMMTLDDEKETFASEKQFMYQQLETKTTEPIKSWLYEQEEGTSPALDLFSGYMVQSIQSSRSSYTNINADLLNFYQSESDFYEQQFYFLKEKEQIRKFYRIIEDLGDAGEIQGDWVDEYLKVNGYTV